MESVVNIDNSDEEIIVLNDKKNLKKELKSPLAKKRTASHEKKPAKRRKVEKIADNNALSKAKSVKSSKSIKVKKTASSETLKKTHENEQMRNEVNFENGQRFMPLWKDESVISHATQVPPAIVKNIISLLDKECTVPFIARYRKEMTGNLQVEKIRDIQESYDSVKTLHKKVDNILKTITKEKDNVDQKVVLDFLNATSMEEVEILYAPFKPGSKKSLAERSKQLGLEPFANNILYGKINYRLDAISKLLDPKQPGLKTVDEVTKGIKHIIADTISKDKEILDFIHNNHQRQFIVISSSKSASATKTEKKDFVEGKENQNFKFENYFNFSVIMRTINPHQVLAINRGEHLKVLTVKLIIPQHFKSDIVKKLSFKYLDSKTDFQTIEFIQTCIDDAMSRLIEPHLFRQIRSELTKKAIKESCSVFCSNLKNMLLTPPVRGNAIIGIDPGFKNGCKTAVISFKGEVLNTDVIYPCKTPVRSEDIHKLINMVCTYKATIIGIGNGCGCRETEKWIADLIKNRAFSPLDVKYCIVNESGASIYSVTKEAEKELPGLDPNLRSAVSIARRLQDPLLEYVKVEPKHLGVGMYQHDVPEAMLKNSLDSVVIECVSFVGVDLNVCPAVLLRKISGLSASRTKQIIEWREQNGCFINRQQLLEVKGLGQKSFEQCAGFVKILPQTSKHDLPSITNEPTDKKKKKKKMHSLNPLDSTIIHPESYDLAEHILLDMKTNTQEIGHPTLENKVKQYLLFTNVEDIAKKFNASAEQVSLILDVFQRPIEYDIREEFSNPIFKTDILKIEDLKTGQALNGKVMNVTHFGAFVDIGVGINGLIHVSKMGRRSVQLGDTVTVSVLSIEINKKRIALSLLSSK